MTRVRTFAALLVLSLCAGCVAFEGALLYAATKDDERNRRRAVRQQQRLARKDQRIRTEAPQCLEPIVEWRRETRNPDRRQALWEALPDECKEQVRRQ